jgi:hypothetical protein
MRKIAAGSRISDEIDPDLTSLRNFKNPDHAREDLQMWKLGILDVKSYWSGYEHNSNNVEVRVTKLLNPKDLSLHHPDTVVRDDNGRPIVDKDWGNWYRRTVAIRRQHNLRLNVGRDQLQRTQNFGDVASGSLNGLLSTAAGAAPTATTFTDTGAAFPTATSTAGNAGLQGKLLFVNATTWTSSVYMPILSNTATVITGDQWYAIPLTGAAGTTPGATRPYFVMPWFGPFYWIALSTSVSAAAATDVTRSADGLWGDGTSGGAATEQTANGLARAFQANAFPSAGQVTATHTWTYTASSSVTIGKVIWFNSLAAAGTIPFLETLLSATATVNQSGDNIQLNTWQVTY